MRFWYRLSGIYGKPVEELQEVISSSEFASLVAADTLGLLPNQWLANSIACREIALIRGQEIPIEHFMPGGKELAVSQSAEQMQAILSAAWSGDCSLGYDWRTQRKPDGVGERGKK